jgi:DNA repair exonuclease SbcCD ATPase subunit
VPAPDQAAALAPVTAPLDEELRAVEQARADLAAMLEAVDRRAEVPKQASRALQERLKLGARMLKAFQVQIDRAEAAAAGAAKRGKAIESLRAELDKVKASARNELDAQAASHLRTVWAEIDALRKELPRGDALEGEADRITSRAMELLEGRLDELSRAAVDRFDALAAARDESLEATSEHLGALQERLERLTGIVETAEVCVAAMSARVAGMEERVAREGAEAAALLDRLEQAGAEARRTAASITERLEESTRRAADLEPRLRDRLADCDAATGRLEQRMSAISETSARVEPVHEACARLEAALALLEPWRPLLLETAVDDDGVPESIAGIVECVREGIGGSVARLAASMGALARQVNDLNVPPTTTTAPQGPRIATPMPEIIKTVKGAVQDVEPKPTLRFQDGRT